jgi:hypothetical protein
MEFNDTTNKQGLIQDIDFRLFGTSSSLNSAYSIEDRTRRINQRINKVVTIIFRNDRRWKYDDFNHDDMNIFYATLFQGQQDYEVSGGDFITISEVFVKDKDGKYQRLTPLVRERGNAQTLQDLEDDDPGMPEYYTKYGNSVMLYPRPDLSYLTADEGFMVRGQRLPSYFISADTTKEAGFNPLFHDYLSAGASYDGALSLGLATKASQLKPELETLEAEIAEHYQSRAEDQQPKMRLKKDNYHDDLYQD